MQTREKKLDSYDVVKNAIIALSGDHNALSAKGDFLIEATVNGRQVFRDVAQCFFVMDSNEAKVSIYWEEAGLFDYKRVGLYGQMSTNFYCVQQLSAGVIRMACPGCEIHINLKV